jgi:hypothetical protein
LLDEVELPGLNIALGNEGIAFALHDTAHVNPAEELEAKLPCPALPWQFPPTGKPRAPMMATRKQRANAKIQKLGTYRSGAFISAKRYSARMRFRTVLQYESSSSPMTQKTGIYPLAAIQTTSAGWMIDLQSPFKSRLPLRDRVESAHLAVQVAKGQRPSAGE